MSTEKPKRQLAAEAGARGKKTAPLSSLKREQNYRHQNFLRGHHFGLTGRQWRQMDRMDERPVKRSLGRALLARDGGR